MNQLPASCACAAQCRPNSPAKRAELRRITTTGNKHATPVMITTWRSEIGTSSAMS